MAKGITRRMLVRLLGLAGMALAVFPASVRAAPKFVEADELEHLYFDRTSARRVGLAYLQDRPGDVSREQLRAQLFSQFKGTPTRESLAALCREDFNAGRTVMVRGWVLAETEAKLCALAALG